MTDAKTLTLADFLLARITEDEADADRWHDIECDIHSLGDAPLVMGPQPCDCKGPARVLAECEAKRCIVELHRRDDGEEGLTYRAWLKAHCPSETLKALALPYADHPDYREEWKV